VGSVKSVLRDMIKSLKTESGKKPDDQALQNGGIKSIIGKRKTVCFTMIATVI
jgi:hypothetical protein